MKTEFVKFLRKLRAPIVRTVNPKLGYFMFIKPTRKIEPISIKFGFDRGKPIDRYYIEDFLKKNSIFIKGRCLEITDNDYTIRYGGNKVTQSDVLDIDRNNKRANIHADLRKASEIKSNTYDCLIITQTLMMIDDYEAAIRECVRILRPNGIMLVTIPCLGPVWNLKNNFWRFTGASASYVFGKYFNEKNLHVETYGNALSGQSFWVGMAVEDMKDKELSLNDPNFPVIVSIRAKKTQQLSKQ